MWIRLWFTEQHENVLLNVDWSFESNQTISLDLFFVNIVVEYTDNVCLACGYGVLV